MRSETPCTAWARRGRVAGRLTAVAISFVFAFTATAADVLFPQPLRLTRTIEDPVSRTTTTVQEYAVGNQFVTVNGDRVAIVDYDRQELTEIDRAAGTYSVARFDEIANAQAAIAPAPRRTGTMSAAAPQWTTVPLGVRSARGRSVDGFELRLERSAGERVRIELGVDRTLRVSRAALEALIGASFPNVRQPEHDAIIGASSARAGDRRILANAASESEYALPIEQVVTYEFEGEALTMRNTVIDVRTELPPDGVRTIPPGAKQVESRVVRLARELRELDQLPSTNDPRQ